MCTFDFDLPNITSIDRRTVLCFTCWEKHLLRPSWKPGHKPPLHYPGCCWQSCDDEPSMVCWELALITTVIYWQLLHPLATAITSWVIGWQFQCFLSLCELGSPKLSTKVNLQWEESTSPSVHKSNIFEDRQPLTVYFVLLIILKVHSRS